MQATEGTTRTTLPGDSLGEVGQLFTAMMNQLVAAGNQALQSGITAMQATGDDVKRSSNAFDRQESDHVSTFGGGIDV